MPDDGGENVKEIHVHIKCSHHSAFFICWSRAQVDAVRELGVSGASCEFAVLQNLLVEPAMAELLGLLHELKQLPVLVWVHLACLDILKQTHLTQ